MKKKLIPMLLALLLLCGCAQESPPQAAVPAGRLETLEISADLKPDAPEDASKLELIKTDEQTALSCAEKCFDTELGSTERSVDPDDGHIYRQNGKIMFMYYPDTGFWSCSVLDAEYPLAKLGTEMSDEEAARIGCEFVRVKGLTDTDAGVVSETELSLDGEDADSVQLKRVDIYPRANGVTVYGESYMVSVEINMNGEIVGIDCRLSQLGAEQSVELTDLDGIEKRLTDIGYKLADKDADACVVGAEYAYFADGSSPELSPIYMLTAQYTDGEGSLHEYSIMVNAAK